MLLDDVSIDDLWALLQPHMGKPAWPGLDDPGLRDRARAASRGNGLWTWLTETLDPDMPLPGVRYSDYRSLRRGGPHRDDRLWMMTDVNRAAFTLWLDHPKASATHLEDLLWAACETTTWVGSFHEYSGLLDLGSTTMAAQYAELLYMVGDRIEPEVVERVRHEVRTRVMDPGVDYRQTPWWATAPMNWNLVCNTNLITCALYEQGDIFVAHYLHPVIQRLHYGLRGFAADGGCYEGPGYWEYAFSHYLKAAIMLRHRTGGALDLMQGEQVEGACRFPLATSLGEGLRMTFCDSGHGHVSAETVRMINVFHEIPALWSLTPRRRRARPGARSTPNWRDFVDLGVARPRRAPRDRSDHLYPALGLVRARAARAPVTLGVFAAHNDCPHNHNDVGTFIYCANGRLPLTDPGSPTYTARIFGPDRYEHPHTRTLGHSLPIVNGHEQAPGRERAGTLQADGLNGRGAKTVVARIEKAYTDPSLRELERRFVLAPDGTLELTDHLLFARKPRSVEEGFATYERARVRRDGREVVIGPRGAQTILAADPACPGRFRLDRWGLEATTWTTKDRLQRIVFTPDSLSRDMLLRFHVRPPATPSS